MTHLTRDELQHWLADGSPADRDRVLAHLAACDACLAACAQMVRERPVDAAPACLDEARFIPRGLAVRTPPRPVRAPVWGSWRLAVAAAALVVIALVVPLSRRALAPEPGGPTRGAIGFSPIAPAGAVTPPVEFRWHRFAAADRYLVDVYHGQEHLGSLTTRDLQASPTPELAARLHAGEGYSWTVTALDAAGEPIATTPLQEFRIAPPSTPPR